MARKGKPEQDSPNGTSKTEQEEDGIQIRNARTDFQDRTAQCTRPVVTEPVSAGNAGKLYGMVGLDVNGPSVTRRWQRRPMIRISLLKNCLPYGTQIFCCNFL